MSGELILIVDDEPKPMSSRVFLSGFTKLINLGGGEAGEGWD